MTLLVIFGAGASFDSVPKRDWNIEQRQSPFLPPLAQQLFEPRDPFRQVIDDYSACVPMIGRLRNLVGRGDYVEEFLEREVERSGQDRRTLSQLTALRYYIRQIIEDCSKKWLELSRRVTNYAILLDTIERWRSEKGEAVALVTFNYDTLLDDACWRSLQWSIIRIHDYLPEQSQYRLFKLHGSVDWLRRIRFPRGSFGPDALIEFAHLIGFQDQYGMKNEVPQDVPSLPAIAIPTQTKSGFECPPDHVEALLRMLPEVTRILVVGWRGQEQHFLNRCETITPAARGLVVSENREAAADTALRLGDRLKIEFHPGDFKGFSGLVDQEDDLMQWLSH